MAYEPTSCIAIPIWRLRQSLITLEAVHDFVGVSDSAAALQHVFINDSPLPADSSQDEYTAAEWTQYNPMIVLSPPEGGEMFVATHEGTGSSFEFVPDYKLRLMFQRIVARLSGEDDSDVDLRFLDDVGRVIEALSDRSGTISGLEFQRIFDSSDFDRFRMRQVPETGELHRWEWTLETEIAI